MTAVEVSIPTPLRSYTNQQSVVSAEGASLGEVLEDLDRYFPGIRFRMIDEQDRIRKHIRFFVNGQVVTALDAAVGPEDEVQIFQALSGG